MWLILLISFFQVSKDSLLLKEVGPEGRGRIAVVEQLLDEVRTVIIPLRTQTSNTSVIFTDKFGFHSVSVEY